MASEASRKKALELCTEEHHSWHTPECGQCANIAAALDEARAEGRKEALGEAIPLKDLMAEARRVARREGAERERWECWTAIYKADTLSDAANAVFARGPMRGPEEE